MLKQHRKKVNFPSQCVELFSWTQVQPKVLKRQTSKLSNTVRIIEITWLVMKISWVKSYKLNIVLKNRKPSLKMAMCFGKIQKFSFFRENLTFLCFLKFSRYFFWDGSIFHATVLEHELKEASAVKSIEKTDFKAFKYS